ncbi:hypothetical protein AVEN_193120-1 [Araneus ventricosus]|uniref:Uncharacterized protein n=1 Tax=Araneus ventricosus TaxID=182803 RepID=A0A4Y2B0L3_ARAVE|nr:hypothetical protein AVEN_193120-1 [Araneus ventricosus]
MDFKIKTCGKIIIYTIIFYVLFCLCLTTVLYFVSYPGSVEDVLKFAKGFLKNRAVEQDNQYLRTLCKMLAPVYKLEFCDERDFSAILKIVINKLEKVAPFLPNDVQSIPNSYRSGLVQMVVTPC